MLQYKLLGSIHSDAKTFIHRTHCGLPWPSTSIDVKAKFKQLSSYFQCLCFFTLLPLVDNVPSLFLYSHISLPHHIFDFYTFSHSCHWLMMCPLYFHSHNAYCCLVKTNPFLKGHTRKNTSKTSLDLITTIFCWYDLRKRPFTEASPKQ
jgi:hypothetical protein